MKPADWLAEHLADLLVGGLIVWLVVYGLVRLIN